MNALLAFCFILFSGASVAQAPVSSIEAIPLDPSANESLQSLVEIQSLREEMSSLRGIIESLEYKIRKLEQQQTENYQDLDGRLSGLYRNGFSTGQENLPEAASSSHVNAVATASSNENQFGQAETTIEAAAIDSSNSSITPVSTGIVPLSEYDVATSGKNAEAKLIYERGFAALRKGEREIAITEFQSIVENYPDSPEMADSLYWLGETNWLANKREESRQSFIQLLENYPSYRKVGDAMYRLGIIYEQLGDKETAYTYMNQVLQSGSSQVSAAQRWIDENPR